jgi:hypothetical protein
MKDKHHFGDEAIEAQYFEQMNQLAQAIDELFNGTEKGKRRQTGFLLMVFPFNEHEGRCNYISNGASRQDVIALFKEQIARFEGMPETKGNA